MEELHPVALHKGTAEPQLCGNLHSQHFSSNGQGRLGRSKLLPVAIPAPLTSEETQGSQTAPCWLLSEPKPQTPGEFPAQGSHPGSGAAPSPEWELPGFFPYQFSVTEPWPLCSFKWQKTLAGCIYLWDRWKQLSPSVLPIVDFQRIHINYFSDEE